MDSHGETDHGVARVGTGSHSVAVVPDRADGHDTMSTRGPDEMFRAARGPGDR